MISDLINKRIVLIYREEDSDTADGIYNKLIENGFLSVSRNPLDSGHSIEQYYHSWSEQMPQLAITLNLAGFEWRNSGGNAMYSMLGFNTFHYINKSVPDEEKLLFGLIPITMKFITDTKQRLDHFSSTYKRIHDITYSDDISEAIPNMLVGLKWRK